MPDPQNPLPYVLVMLIGGILWFIRDKHNRIMASLEQKATLDALIESKLNAQKQLDDAKESWRADLRQQNERHEHETARLERQYEQKFAAVVSQFQDRMDSIEKNLADKMNMILHIVERRNQT